MNNKEQEYFPRISDKLIDRKLHTSGAVLITGCKWCGKTMSAEQFAKSVIYMQDPDKSSAYLSMADTKPSLLLTGENPRLIDEWQMAPVIWDAVRYEVDRRRSQGQFILTGSAVPLDNATFHTGTGRISRMMMRTMSLFESKESSGTVSLRALFNNDQEEGFSSKLSVEDISYLICRGGWPMSLTLPKEYALDVVKNYVDAVIEEDISRVDGIERNPQRVMTLLKSLSRNISTMATNTTILSDFGNSGTSMSLPTLDTYLNALRRIFVIEDVPAWSPSMRSKTALRTSAKRNFVDPSIATAALRIGPEKLLRDFNSFGFLFESLCVRDIRVYAQANDGDIYHYRDKNELEADIIISLRDGRWAPVEVKLGQKQIEEAAAHLIKLSEKVNSEKMGAPSFMMVLTAGEFAYRRKDGVWVVPLGCLRD
ncbi:MAG: ATP-binding protein [Bacteroidales bacterium]|nr:ATP-binding protein [Bacteroidales bacterium]MBD5351820.1 ATP-binding protein [Bacteroides sp.]MBD5363287.1 ATP-binding protein [Bacteroides sp.]